MARRSSLEKKTDWMGEKIEMMRGGNRLDEKRRMVGWRNHLGKKKGWMGERWRIPSRREVSTDFILSIIGQVLLIWQMPFKKAGFPSSQTPTTSVTPPIQTHTPPSIEQTSYQEPLAIYLTYGSIRHFLSVFCITYNYPKSGGIV